ncbi:MAG TPA: thioredoxin [Paludibacteraceae bacterium]|nr:thioredoxin [Paludibacteraceae bacterium]
MKFKTVILVAVALTTFSCNGQAKKTEQETTNKQQKTMGTIHLTKEEFLKKVVNYEANPTEWKYLGDKPAIIDFYASWCGPCKMIAPILEELAAEYDGQIYIYKVDTEAEQELAAVFNIRSIPSILFVPMEGQPQMAQGAMPKASLKEAIESVLLVKEKK